MAPPCGPGKKDTGVITRLTRKKAATSLQKIPEFVMKQMVFYEMRFHDNISVYLYNIIRICRSNSYISNSTQLKAIIRLPFKSKKQAAIALCRIEQTILFKAKRVVWRIVSQSPAWGSFRLSAILFLTLRRLYTRESPALSRTLSARNMALLPA